MHPLQPRSFATRDEGDRALQEWARPYKAHPVVVEVQDLKCDRITLASVPTSNAKMWALALRRTTTYLLWGLLPVGAVVGSVVLRSDTEPPVPFEDQGPFPLIWCFDQEFNLDEARLALLSRYARYSSTTRLDALGYALALRAVPPELVVSFLWWERKLARSRLVWWPGSIGRVLQHFLGADARPRGAEGAWTVAFEHVTSLLPLVYQNPDLRGDEELLGPYSMDLGDGFLTGPERVFLDVALDLLEKQTRQHLQEVVPITDPRLRGMLDTFQYRLVLSRPPKPRPVPAAVNHFTSDIEDLCKAMPPCMKALADIAFDKGVLNFAERGVFYRFALGAGIPADAIVERSRNAVLQHRDDKYLKQTTQRELYATQKWLAKSPSVSDSCMTLQTGESKRGDVVVRRDKSCMCPYGAKGGAKCNAWQARVTGVQPKELPTHPLRVAQFVATQLKKGHSV